MSLPNTLRLTALGLALATMTGCSLFRSAPTQPPVTDNGPLAPAIASGDNRGLDSAAKIVFCTPQQVAALAASQGDKAVAAAIATRTFYFATDSSNLDKDSVANLTLQAKLLAAVPALRLQLSGHTDERGTPDYNMALGERRANAAASLLGNSGVAAGQLNVVSYGKEKPAVDGHDESAWSKNRRIELDYSGACLK